MKNLQILGSSHISGQFAYKIKDIILTEEPEIVAVELDLQRLESLFSNQRNKYSLKSIKQIGIFGFIFGLIGSKMQSVLGRQVGFQPGIDMKTAVLAAKKVKSKIMLIDQPIEITLNKLSQIKTRDKLKLIFYILFSPFSRKNQKLAKKIDLRKVPEEKIIEEMTAEFKKKVPAFYKILIEERNKIIAKNIISIQKKYPDSRIIAVIGAGHKKEVEQLIKNSK